MQSCFPMEMWKMKFDVILSLRMREIAKILTRMETMFEKEIVKEDGLYEADEVIANFLTKNEKIVAEIKK